MVIAISGICGFIGRRLAERLLSKGYVVKGMDLDENQVAQIKKFLFVDAFVGDITSSADCDILTQQVDVVVHTAAKVKEDGNWDDFRRINVLGTENIAKSAKNNGVRHFIHLSSVMVYGFEFPPHCAENSPMNGDKNPYCTTKIEAEEILFPLGDETFGITILRPGDVYGPGSVPWIIRPLEMKSAMQFILPDNGRGVFNSLYIDNLIDALLICIEEKAYGKIYNVTDDAPITNKVFYEKLFALCGMGTLLTMPKSILFPLSGMYSTLLSYMKKSAEVNPQAVRYMLRPHSYSCRKIKDELGYFPKIKLDEGLKITHQWLKQHRPDLIAK